MKPKYSNDHNFKVLFSNPTMLRELVEFIQPELAQKLDWTKTKPPDTEKSYLTEELKKYSEDLVAEIPLKKSHESIYLVLLIEFQTTVERFMPLRVLNYLTLFWLDWLKRHKKTKTQLLPPVFPVVFYNGKSNWNHPANIKELIYPFEDSYQFNPDFQFYPFYLNQLKMDDINRLHNALGTVLKLERSIILPETIKEITKQRTNLDNSNREVVKLITLWLSRLLESKRISPEDLKKINDIQPEFEEEQTMLTEALNNYYEETLQKGMAAGLEQGLEKGIEQGKAEGRSEEKRETARNLFNAGVSPEIIAKATGLSLEEVEKLQSENTR